MPEPETRDPDPYVFYTVVRRSLKLSTGKAVAQGQHAMDYLTREVDRLQDIDDREAWRKLPDDESERMEMALTRLATFQTWRYSRDHAKIVLGASDAEFEQVKTENPEHFLVTDLGYTQVAPDTVTCLGLWPMRKSQASPTVKTLRPL